MSGDEATPTLTRSSSGSFRPCRRPPLNRSTSKSKMTTEDVPGFLVKESGFIEVTDFEQNSRPELHDMSDTEESEKESKDDNEDDQNSEDSSFEGTEPKILESTNILRKKMEVKEDKQQHQGEKKGFNDFTICRKENLKVFSCILLVISVATFYCIPPSLSTVNALNKIDLSTVKEKFSTQDDDLWIVFEAGVQDVVKLNKPSTFILLYKENAEATVENFLKQITKYAVCEVTDCSKEPIILTDTELNSSENIEDYGRILNKYRNKLQENGVMVIKHLENVRGVAAQVFHSLCDEVTPLVKRSLFIFTMNFHDFDGKNKMSFVDNYFRKKWTDINVDTFNALITRITNMVVEIKP